MTHKSMYHFFHPLFQKQTIKQTKDNIIKLWVENSFASGVEYFRLIFFTRERLKKKLSQTQYLYCL